MKLSFCQALVSTRAFWVLIHRYAGLSIALFLTIAGLTGAVLPFAAPLHRWLNPPIQVTPGAGEPLDPFTLRERALALQPEGTLNVVLFQRQPNEAFEADFSPRTTSTNESAPVLSFSHLVLNPYTGEELHREPAKGLFFYFFRSDRDLAREGGNSAVIFDGVTGALVGVDLPTGENAARTFTSWIVMLHVAGVGGMPYRIVVTLLGLAITTLSVTGVWIWWKKRSLRRHRA